MSVLLLLLIICMHLGLCFFFFKQKTAYEMRISDWSSDVCSSDLQEGAAFPPREQPDDERGAGVADMQEAGRAGRETDGDGHGQIGRASCRERVCQYV